MYLAQPEVLALVTQQAQQVPGQPLSGIKVVAGRVRFDLAEQHLIQSLQGLILHCALRVHHSWHHTLQPRLLHHTALWFSLVVRRKTFTNVSWKMWKCIFFSLFLFPRFFAQSADKMFVCLSELLVKVIVWFI